MIMNMKLKHYIAAVGLAATFVACNDDFMERYPLDVPTDETFWTSESDLKLFLNKLYPTWLQGHGSGWSDSKYLYPLPVTGSPLAYGDVYSDNAVRTGNEYTELGEANKIPTGSGSDSNGWSWGDLRNVNYFLTHYTLADLPAETLAQYAGEAYFFKAWEYYRKVLFFGDVPWLTRELNTDSEELQMARTPRAEVMDSVLMCINRAVEGLPEKGSEESGRLNKDMANFLKARICLFEGTYRKYHKDLGLDPTKFLQECETACEALLGKYSLYTGDGATSYYKMFTVKGPNAYSSNPEIILGRTYIENEYGNVDRNSHWARLGDTVTLRYVEESEYYDPDTGEVWASLEDVPDGANWVERPVQYRDVDYTVTALVAVPSALSYRYYGSDEFILNDQTFVQDTGTDSIMYYAFDTADEANAAMESFLADYTENVDPELDYESKATYAGEFESMRSMFLLLGGALSFIVGLVGVLNFFNAILTGIIARQRELAVLQAVGMTGKQLRAMLIWEGLLYALGAAGLALILTLTLGPVAFRAVEGLFWFFTYRLNLTPFLFILPLFALLGAGIPVLTGHAMAKRTVVERLRME